jgi:plasmid maintenance system antidote protein VapI
MNPKLSLTHPGIILHDEFFEPMGITQLAAAEATGIPQSRLSEWCLLDLRSAICETISSLTLVATFRNQYVSVQR